MLTGTLIRQLIIPESGKFSHVQTSHCAGACRARGGVRLASRCPAAVGNQRGYAEVQDGDLYRIDLRIPATDGLPFCSQWSQSAGGLCWCDGHNWPRCGNHGRRAHGVGRICPHHRSKTRSACRHLCGCEWCNWSWRRRWCQPPVRRNRTFDRSAAAFCRGVGWDQPVSWSFKSHAFLGPMRILQKTSSASIATRGDFDKAARSGASHQRTFDENHSETTGQAWIVAVASHFVRWFRFRADRSRKDGSGEADGQGCQTRERLCQGHKEVLQNGNAG